MVSCTTTGGYTVEDNSLLVWLTGHVDEQFGITDRGYGRGRGRGGGGAGDLQGTLNFRAFLVFGTFDSM